MRFAARPLLQPGFMNKGTSSQSAPTFSPGNISGFKCNRQLVFFILDVLQVALHLWLASVSRKARQWPVNLTARKSRRVRESHCRLLRTRPRRLRTSSLKLPEISLCQCRRDFPPPAGPGVCQPGSLGSWAISALANEGAQPPCVHSMLVLPEEAHWHRPLM